MIRSNRNLAVYLFFLRTWSMDDTHFSIILFFFGNRIAQQTHFEEQKIAKNVYV